MERWFSTIIFNLCARKLLGFFFCVCFVYSPLAPTFPFEMSNEINFLCELLANWTIKYSNPPVLILFLSCVVPSANNSIFFYCVCCCSAAVLQDKAKYFREAFFFWEEVTICEQKHRQNSSFSMEITLLSIHNCTVFKSLFSSNCTELTVPKIEHLGFPEIKVLRK